MHSVRGGSEECGVYCSHGAEKEFEQIMQDREGSWESSSRIAWKCDIYVLWNVLVTGESKVLRRKQLTEEKCFFFPSPPLFSPIEIAGVWTKKIFIWS